MPKFSPVSLLLEDNLEVSMSLGKGKVGEKMSEVPKMQRAN